MTALSKNVSKTWPRRGRVPEDANISAAGTLSRVRKRRKTQTREKGKETKKEVEK